MQALNNLPLFCHEYQKTTEQLRTLIPSLNEGIPQALRSEAMKSGTQPDDEVYNGLPTYHNTKPMIDHLSKCIPSSGFTVPEKGPKFPSRQVLTRLELVAIIASVYELHSTELSAWQAFELIASNTSRQFDQMYGLMNRAFLKLRVAERTFFDNREELMKKVNRVQTALKTKASIIEAFHDSVTTGVIPSAHASLQCIISDAILLYVQHYNDWFALSSRLEIVTLRYKEFLSSKVWAAVYAYAFLNWLKLRAQVTFGAEALPLGEDDSETCISPMYAAINVRTYGRTLVKFMMNEAKDGQLSDLSEAQMLNIWLGSRLLLHATIQVAELYTLFGTMKEARVYQLELLRIAQRFHIPSCAQSALCMMAYSDLLCQRVWSFDLRLAQLRHIITSKVSLDEIISSRSSASKKQQRGAETEDEEEEERQFLVSGDRARPRETRHEDDESSGEALGVYATASEGGVAGILPAATPLPGTAVMNTPSGFPCAEEVTKLIVKSSTTQEETPQEGVLTAQACAHWILNGCLWLWVGEVAKVVRSDIVERNYLLPALIPPQEKPEKKEKEEEEELSTELASKCKVSTGVGATPALTKAARAAKSCFRTPMPKAGAVRPPPRAPRKFQGDLAFSPRKTRRATAAKAKPSEPETTRCTKLEDLNARLTSRVPVKVNPRVPPPFFGLKPVFKAKQTAGETLQILKDPDAKEEMMKCNAGGAGDKWSDSSDERQQEATSEGGETDEPVENCPPVVKRPPVRQNMRLLKQYLERDQHGLQMPPTPTESGLDDVEMAEEECRQETTARRLLEVYRVLAGLPVPHLMRPVCQWLGLRLLGRGDQEQASRYFGQAIGISPGTLFNSIIASKIRHEGMSKVQRCFQALAPPNDSIAYLVANSAKLPRIHVVQLMLVDEVGLRLPGDDGDSANDLVSGGLGARKQTHLVATRWRIGGKVDGEAEVEEEEGTEATLAESRVMHRFAATGLHHLKTFEDLQCRNVESMQVQDRRKFWSERFSLDSRLQDLIHQIRTQWFSPEDLQWLRMRDLSPPNTSHILLLDRQLNLLPLEWVIWDGEGVEDSLVPGVCRNFSLSLALSHLCMLGGGRGSVTFDPSSAYYVMNPEANLPNTEATFRAFFSRHCASWRGICSRSPTAEEVIEGLSRSDLFVYLGHGNGSRCLMPAFDEGVSTRAVALIMGCSSGKTRIEGRFEAYASIFNHLITGAPTAVSLLWDVTDKDIDRFTQEFLGLWILGKKTEAAEEEETTTTRDRDVSMTARIFQATKACKLRSLVAKSVIAYGVPAYPK